MSTPAPSCCPDPCNLLCALALSIADRSRLPAYAHHYARSQILHHGLGKAASLREAQGMHGGGMGLRPTPSRGAAATLGTECPCFNAHHGTYMQLDQPLSTCVGRWGRRAGWRPPQDHVALSSVRSLAPHVMRGTRAPLTSGAADVQRHCLGTLDDVVLYANASSCRLYRVSV